MKKSLFFILWAAMACAFGASAQIVTTEPELLQEGSRDVTLTYHADQGNRGLAGLGASTQVYAHIGVITTKSTGTSDWKYVVTNWPSSAGDTQANTAKNRLTYVSPDTWRLSIGDIRTYFGIADANEHVTHIALVFRNADGSREGKTQSGGDILVEVLDEGFGLALGSDVTSDLVTEPTAVNLSALTTLAADISIEVNGSVLASVKDATKLTATYTISAPGSYVFTATATRGGETLTKTLTKGYPGTSAPGTYPGGVPKQGAVKNADGTVTFCLAAPGKQSVVIVGEWDDYKILDSNVMKYQDYNGQRYFFTTVSGLKDDVWYPYYYIVDGTYKVGDPYARLVLDNNSDKWLDTTVWPDMPRYPYDKVDDTMLAVYRGDLDGNFQFSPFKIPDHGNLVIYEMLFRDFTGTEGKAEANGTIRKAMEKIPYLASLGVNAVELMPVMEFNGNNSWGYNTNFYFAPDKAYGSPDDLKEFVEMCHRHGMAVILDIVFNQSDGLHPWYQMYGGASGIASNPFYNAVAPHSYSVLNDWKQEHPLVLQQEKDAITYWMTNYNVDGFRFDLVKGLGTSYPGNTDGYNASRVVRMKELHAAIKAVKPDGIHINENLAGAQEENEMAADGQLNWANINDASLQFAMGYSDRSNLDRFYAPNDSRTWGSTISYAESHDEERLAYKQKTYGAANVKGNHENSMKRLGQVAAQMLMTPGPKMIWQFGELGADQTEKTAIGNDVDPKIVIWSYLEDADRKALHDTYQALCHFRTHNPELFSNTATFTLTGFANNISSNRIMRLTNGDQEVMVFINPRISGGNINVGATATKLSPSNAQLITAHKDFNGTLTGSGSSVGVSLPPHGYALYATRNTVGVDDIVSDGIGSNVNVSGGYGEIFIDGNYDSASVFDLSGVARPTAGLTPGIYIVVVDGTSFKVSVN